MKLRLQDSSLDWALPRLGILCWGCRMPDYLCPGGVSMTPCIVHRAPQHLSPGDITKHVNPDFKAHGEDSEGDTTKIQPLLSPCSFGTCLAGGSDGDDWTELGQMPRE